MSALTVQDWLTSSGKYAWRATHIEVTPEVLASAKDLVERINAILKDLRIYNAKFSSGFRPSDVNKKTPGASKKSGHMTGTSADLEDKDGNLDFQMTMNPRVLIKHGLYQEDPRHTEGWAHCQSLPPKSGKRVFIP